MARGKEIGTWELKDIGGTFTPGGNLSVSVNMEGKGTGVIGGTARGTLALDGVLDGKGAYTWCGALIREDRSLLGMTGQGTWEMAAEPGKWRILGVLRYADGQVAAVEGEGDYVARTLVGKAYEWA